MMFARLYFYIFYSSVVLLLKTMKYIGKKQNTVLYETPISNMMIFIPKGFSDSISFISVWI